MQQSLGLFYSFTLFYKRYRLSMNYNIKKLYRFMYVSCPIIYQNPFPKNLRSYLILAANDLQNPCTLMFNLNNFLKKRFKWFKCFLINNKNERKRLNNTLVKKYIFIRSWKYVSSNNLIVYESPLDFKCIVCVRDLLLNLG